MSPITLYSRPLEYSTKHASRDHMISMHKCSKDITENFKLLLHTLHAVNHEWRVPKPSLHLSYSLVHSLDKSLILAELEIVHMSWTFWIHSFNNHFFFLKNFIYLFLERGEGRETRRETLMCGCLSSTPYWGPGLQPRHVH